MSAKLHSLFTTPVAVVPVADAATLNTELKAVIAARRRVEAGVQRSNIGGWQSEIDMLDWGGGAARRLAALVTQACDAWTTSVDDDRSVVWRPEIWANVNVHGSSNQTHWHPGSYLSFVYYVDDGYAGSSDKALGGEIVFIDPRMPILRMRTPALRHRGAGGQTAEQETWVRPFSGLLIGFPSFLGHSVRAYLGQGERISIAINMVARRAPGAKP
ncbi:TIGR02466 family protein [uncultured Sphingomonas sp.]|uniref:TIGR02466 family protein n=1 Tax=uncultured Sphingomonas sp. TaxID=158754 RepID=UPI0025FB4A4B|nr:TIGR02466 family protein [uncultured Sphingomonas sp.]